MTNRQRDKLRRIAGLYPQQYRSLALLGAFDSTAQIDRGRNFLPGRFDDHVSSLNTALGGYAIWVNVGDDHSVGARAGRD